MSSYIARKLIEYPSKQLLGYALISEDRLDTLSISKCCKDLISIINDDIGAKELEEIFNEINCYMFSNKDIMEMWCAINGHDHSRIKSKTIYPDLDYDEIFSLEEEYYQQFSQ